jgi:hypothetical protein
MEQFGPIYSNAASKTDYFHYNVCAIILALLKYFTNRRVQKVTGDLCVAKKGNPEIHNETS